MFAPLLLGGRVGLAEIVALTVAVRKLVPRLLRGAGLFAMVAVVVVVVVVLVLVLLLLLLLLLVLLLLLWLRAMGATAAGDVIVVLGWTETVTLRL